MNFKPVSNYMLVRPIEISNTTKSGLVLPESSLDKPNMGRVISVGKGQISSDGVLMPMFVSVGETVLFTRYSGTEIKLNSEKYLILRDTDILGIVEDE